MYLVIILLLNCIFSSCTHFRYENWKINNNDKVKHKISSLVYNGEYAQAIELITAAVKSGKSELSYGNQYVDSINGLAAKGMAYYSVGDYEHAGIILKKVINNFPSNKSLATKIKYSQEEIKSYINELTEKLMEEGVFKYREGNLVNAISIWEKILKYDPDHIKANKMVDTATTQMNYLKTVE
ncbi:MAG: tetratricopeptide repeat protein [Candidatus Scalinduaceae bacterium]